jgi:hypothetical protein
MTSTRTMRYRDRYRDTGPGCGPPNLPTGTVTCEDVGAPEGIRTPNLLIRTAPSCAPVPAHSSPPTAPPLGGGAGAMRYNDVAVTVAVTLRTCSGRMPCV